MAFNSRLQTYEILTSDDQMFILCLSYFITKVRCAILISFKIVVIFNTTSADIKTKSADVILKMTTILKEMRIVQLFLKWTRTFSLFSSHHIFTWFKGHAYHFYDVVVFMEANRAWKYLLVTEWTGQKNCSLKDLDNDCAIT